MAPENQPGLVSIVIPTYNRSSFLQEAIQSVINQTYRPIECIIVDDGSIDNTGEIVSAMRGSDISSFAIKYFHQINAGSQIARNKGTSEASGEFIQYLDSDDLLYADKIQSQVNFLQRHPECDAVFGDWEEGLPGIKKKITAYKKDDLLLQLLTDRCVSNFAILLRRNLVEKIGVWDANIKRNQEIDFHLKGVLAGGNFVYQPFTTGLWRIHPQKRIGNTTKFSDAINFYRKWEDILDNRQLWNESYSKGVVNNYMWFLSNYADANNKEIKKLLHEVHRLQPIHPIFRSWKYRFAKRVFGFEKAADLWIIRYKKMK